MPRGSLIATVLVAAWVLLAGCQRTLIPTPVMYVDSDIDPFQDLPASDQRTATDIFVVTNRLPNNPGHPKTAYSKHRASELRLARATVTIGSGFTWDELVEQSLRHRRSRQPRFA